MKATLEFNLPEDQAEFRYASDGAKAHIVLEHIDEYLRRAIKDGVTTTLEAVREELHDALNEYDITLWRNG